jgi:rhamnosyl/mannosyltransferase
METHLQTLARGQAASGAAVRVVCVNHDPARKTVQERDGPVRVTRVARQASVRGLDVCPDLLNVFSELRRQRPDIVHLHTPNPTMLLPLMAFRPSAAVVVMHHSDIIRQRFLRIVHRPFEWAVYRRAAAILTTSPNYAEGSAALARFRHKLRVFPMGLDLSPFLKPSQASRSYGDSFRARHGGPLWLCVGRLVYYKGLSVALEALREVPGRLAIVGTGPLEADLRARAKRLGVADRIVWCGTVTTEELIGIYRVATALWFPSVARSEAFGLVQVEAMAAGCPVLNSAIPGSGVTWVSRHEETGLTVPVGDAGALAAAARRLLKDPTLHERLATAGVHRAQHDFDHQAMTRRCFDLYDSLMARDEGVWHTQPNLQPELAL